MQLTENSTYHQEGTKTKKIIVFLLLVSLVVFTVFFINRKNNNAPASDPHFTSYKNQLAKGFPDFPVYAGTKIEESRKETNAIDKKKGFSALWKIETEKSVPEIADWYETELEKSGWTMEETPDKHMDEIILKAKKESVSAIVIIEKENMKETEILIDIPLAEL